MTAETAPTETLPSPSTSVPVRWQKGVKHPQPWDRMELTRSEKRYRADIARCLCQHAGLGRQHANSLARQAVTYRRLIEAARRLAPEQVLGQIHVIAGIEEKLGAIEALAYARPAHRGQLQAPEPPQAPA